MSERYREKVFSDPASPSSLATSDRIEGEPTVRYHLGRHRHRARAPQKSAASLQDSQAFPESQNMGARNRHNGFASPRLSRQSHGNRHKFPCEEKFFPLI